MAPAGERSVEAGSLSAKEHTWISNAEYRQLAFQGINGFDVLFRPR
jgi:hypothetical protein